MALKFWKFAWGFMQRIHLHYRMMRDPVGYVRSLGVRLGENVTFYGLWPGMFGTEPWLITIGDNVYITADVQFITHDGGTLIFRNDVPDLEWTAPIKIGNEVYIGVKTTILPGVKIGNRCIIGACSTVTRDIPDNSVAAGCPARVIRSTDDYLERMKAKSLKCGHLIGEEKARVLKKIYGIE
jgi:acetyltransferase-like isoleucine patch superfamily enzyme